MLEINTTERELLKKILAVKNESLKIEHESAKLQQKQMALLAEQLDALEKHHEDDLKKIKLLQEMAVAPKRKERPASSFFSPTISSSNKDKKAIYPKAK
ncbi:MAG: hypothetical protein Q8L78_07760 [Coxiellaceae bacterium]|nr:hypothetical protein [Coxiellaceae bacterium]